MTTDHPPVVVDTVVVGGGQAGLAAGYHLARLQREFVILDAGEHSGDSWRHRWESLRLFTPAGYSHLPGTPFPGRRERFPAKDEMADYLDGYAERHRLPIEHGVRVESLAQTSDGFALVAGQRRWSACHVIVATGAHSTPRVPPFVGDLDADHTQLTSLDYREPAQLPPGAVLVVGAGNSGAEIALDLATRSSPRRRVLLAGRDVGYVPRLGTGTAAYPLMRLLGHWGARQVRRRLGDAGDPLGGVRPAQLVDAGVVRTARVTGTRDGKPLLVDGDTLDVTTVVWCTGLAPRYDWLSPELLDGTGQLRHHRGVTDRPGLYVLGLPYQSTIVSHLVGGVGADAARVVGHLATRSLSSANPSRRRPVRSLGRQPVFRRRPTRRSAVRRAEDATLP